MKTIKSKILLILVFFIFTNITFGQNFDRAIGGRFGTDFMLSYKQFFMYYPEPQLSFEVLVGLQVDERILNRRAIINQTNGFVVQGMCYYHLDIGFDTNFSFFTGLGPFMGVYTPQGQKPRFGGGLAAAAGLSYTFRFIPLDISIDWMPMLGSPRSSITRGGLTLRYIFPNF
jgi:hypothetical protein